MVSFPVLPDEPDWQYKTIMAEPPWAYDDDLYCRVQPSDWIFVVGDRGTIFKRDCNSIIRLVQDNTEPICVRVEISSNL